MIAPCCNPVFLEGGRFSSIASTFSCKWSISYPLFTAADILSSFAGGFFLLLYYLPIYFQSVDGVSASQSGINNIPLVLGVCKSPRVAFPKSRN